MELENAKNIIYACIYFKDVEIAIRHYFGLSEVNEHLHRTCRFRHCPEISRQAASSSLLGLDASIYCLGCISLKQTPSGGNILMRTLFSILKDFQQDK